MPGSANLIPRNRLKWIPKNLRLAHEYCFFLHDEGARLLVEYEKEQAHLVSVKFRHKAESKAFSKISENEDPIAALRSLGYESEARRAILNNITMGMVSDCLHHIYEALRCLEKRKVIVALNLLRKPLTDSLLYLSWIFGDEDGFYHAFTQNSPHGITSSILKSRRNEILSAALRKTELGTIIDADFIDEILFDQTDSSGFQMLFQHAVHLVTVQRVALQTTSENFNFIFKNYADDDLYEFVYEFLPHVFIYLTHVVFGLFERIAIPDTGSKSAFYVRSVLGLHLVGGNGAEKFAFKILKKLPLQCPNCSLALKLTIHNAARLVLSESFRCTKCRHAQPFPFSWIF
jgi:hypothetical protein